VKYFTVTVGLDQADPEWITPGAIVSAVILIDRVDEAIAVPNQSLYRKDDSDWVIIRRGDRLERRDVQLGLRGPNRSQVVAGLNPGDEVALFLPGASGT
jgi:hypothetical protein